jgi:uncharacterized protein (TIGR03437 family)
MKLARFLLPVLAAAALHAQSWDNSGNSMLKGEYYFRQVIYIIGDDAGDLSEAAAVYGNINFHGDGTYGITTAENAVYNDTSNGSGPLVTSGTYSIAASGYGFISSPYITGDLIFGSVNSQGIFVASSTENSYGYNDMFIAAQIASPLPTASSFTGTWTCADFDLSSGAPSSALSLMFTMTPNGVSSLGTVNVSGYYGASTTALPPQTYNGLIYAFSNGAAVAKFPSISNDYLQANKYFYFSKDGNFLFGGSPNGFDMIVGVKSTSTTPALSGTYYQAGLDEVGGSLDSFYGSFSVNAGAAPPCASPLTSTCQALVGHERINEFGSSSISDYTYDDTISLSGNSFANTFARYIVGDGGAVEITSGIGPYLGLSVAVQAPGFTPTGVYIYPTGVINAASSAPFTASIAPGELLTLYGSNLAPASPPITIGPSPFLTSVGNVQVSIGGLPAPIYYVSPGQISAVVPYGITASTTCGCVQIQVTNNGQLSNIVTEYVGQTAPGVFTIPAGGLGYGAIEDATTGALINAANPAVPGEILAVYLTGLGAVTPGVADGALGGPYPGTNNATNTFSVEFGSATAAAPVFAGLAPGLSGLYQMNVTVPTGLTAGPNFLTISGPDSVMSYLIVPIAASTSSSDTANARIAPQQTAVPARYRKPTTPVKSGMRRVFTGGGN